MLVRKIWEIMEKYEFVTIWREVYSVKWACSFLWTLSTMFTFTHAANSTPYSKAVWTTFWSRGFITRHKWSKNVFGLPLRPFACLHRAKNKQKRKKQQKKYWKFNNSLLKQNQHTRELIIARNTQHNYNNKDLSRLRWLSPGMRANTRYKNTTRG